MSRQILLLHHNWILLEKSASPFMVYFYTVLIWLYETIKNLHHFQKSQINGQDFLVAVGMTLLNNISWVINFYYKFQKDRFLTRLQVLAFFQLLVWAAPFVFFLALESEFQTLPSSSSTSVTNDAPSLPPNTSNYMNDLRGKGGSLVWFFF